MIKKIVSKLLVLSTVLAVFLPTVANAEQMTFGQVLDDLSKAQAELNANNQQIKNNENKKNNDTATISSLKNQISFKKKLLHQTMKLKKKESKLKALLLTYK